MTPRKIINRILQVTWRLVVAAMLAMPVMLTAPLESVKADFPIPVVGVFASYVNRVRVYRTANAYIARRNAYNDRLRAKALEQLRTRKLGGLRQSQLAAFIKVAALIERERKAMDAFAESEKKGAHDKFINQAGNALASVLLPSSGAMRVLGAMKNGIQSSQGFIKQAINKLAGGSGGVLAEIERVRQTAAWVSISGEIIGGRVGSRIRSAGNHVVAGIDGSKARIQEGLERANADLDDLSAAVDDLQGRVYGPRAGDAAADAVISIVTGDEAADPSVEAILDMLDRSRRGNFRDRAAEALVSQSVVRCTAIRDQYHGILFKLQLPAVDEQTLAEIQVPDCQVIPLDEWAQADGEEAVGQQPPPPVEVSPVVEPTLTTPAAAPTAQAVPPTKAVSQYPAPCELMPGGTIVTNDANSCFATFSSQPGGRTVSLGLLYPGVDPAITCRSIASGSDYATVMGEYPLGDCGYLVDSNYQGKKVGGYTGWNIHFILDRFTVRVATNEEYPANKDWAESTAAQIEENIQAFLDSP